MKYIVFLLFMILSSVFLNANELKSYPVDVVDTKEVNVSKNSESLMSYENELNKEKLINNSILEFKLNSPRVLKKITKTKEEAKSTLKYLQRLEKNESFRVCERERGTLSNAMLIKENALDYLKKGKTDKSSYDDFVFEQNKKIKKLKTFLRTNCREN